MEIGKIVDQSPDRILLERTDNGVILVDISASNVAQTKMVYEIWSKQGNIDYFKLAAMLFDVAEYLKIPTEAPDLNSKLEMYVEKMDPDKPFPGEEEGAEDDDEEDED